MVVRKNIKTRSKKKKAKTLVDQEKYSEAHALYQKICKTDKRDADAWHALGVISGFLGNKEQAINSLYQAIQLNPKRALSHYNLGVIYRDAGQLDESIVAFHAAVKLKPDYKEACECLAQEYGNAKQYDKSIETIYKLIELDPENSGYKHNLAFMFQVKGMLDEAIKSYRDALTATPNSTLSLDSLGSALGKSGQFHEAIETYRQSLTIDPSNARGHSNLLLTLNYIDNLTPLQVFEEHKSWGEQHSNKTIQPLKVDYSKDRSLRIGYISSDFREHSVAYFIEPLLDSHDKKNFEIFCYSSVIQGGDETTKRIKSLATHWRDISKQMIAETINQIRKDRIDILIDLSGHTGHNHLKVFTAKPAPIQVTWLGYPNTTGLQTIDYRIVDNITDPEGYDAYCTEELIRIPGCFICYKPPEISPDIDVLPFEKNNYITFGSFNNLSKIGSHVVKVWSRLLLKIPNAHLIIKNHSLTNESSKIKYRQYFEEQGIESERLELIGHIETRNEHLDLYNRIDIALDVYPYNGTTTTCEALWMGVPVICKRGDRHAARVSASLLNNIYLEELIATDDEDYISIACKLASDTIYLSKLRSFMRQRMLDSTLCNTQSFTHKIENIFRKIWRECCDKEETRQ